MKQTLKTVFLTSCLTLCAAIPAQTQLLRGKVEDVRNTTNKFYLDGTGIALVSSALDLNLVVGQYLDMQVTDVSQGGRTTLDVRAATPSAKIMDMGNLRIGRTEQWEVNGTPGSRTGVFVTLTSMTSYVPFGTSGTWLLGSVAPMLTSGTIGALGKFQFGLAVPNIPGLVGTGFTSQAVVIDPQGALILSNPDGKEVRAN